MLALSCICVCACVCTLVLSHVHLFYDPMDYSPPDSSVHGISQARILEWVAISFSSGSSWPRDRTLVYPALAGGFFTAAATWKRNLFHVFEMFDFPSQNFAQQGNGSPWNPTEIWGRSTHSSVNACSRAAASLNSSKKHQNFLFCVLSVPCVYMKVLAPDYCLCLIWAFYSQNPACWL